MARAALAWASSCFVGSRCVPQKLPLACGACLEPQSVDFVAIRHEDDMGLRNKCLGPVATLQHVGEAYAAHAFPAISGRYGEGRVS